jgi:tRNA pseudouridine38-40 synthase
MPAVRLTVEYDGTNFSGFQFQPTLRTIAGELERILSRIFDEPIKITCAGRTDAGVHATGQVVSFATTRDGFPFDCLAIALNSALPSDLTIRGATLVDDDFSARFSAIERTYIYAILNHREPSALLARYAYHVWHTVDLDRAGDAAALLIGTHDFRSFCATLPENGNTVRTVHALTIQKTGDMIRLKITADGFLHKMVRTIVGTLLECGTGRRDPESFQEILAAKDRTHAGLTAPSHGLCLAGVRYRDGYNSYKEPGG